MVKTARQIVEEFHELAEGRCAFDLLNGEHLEGYLMNVEDAQVEFGSGDPLAPDENEFIPI